MSRVYVRGSARERFWGHVVICGECWLWQGARDKKGYGRFWAGGSAFVLAHRYSVLHRCDTPACVCPDHLFLGTKAYNNEDMRRKGRDSRVGLFAPGHRAHAILTAGQAAEIHARYVPGVITAKMLAAEYGVSPSTVYAIASGQNWRELASARAGTAG